MARLASPPAGSLGRYILVTERIKSIDTDGSFTYDQDPSSLHLQQRDTGTGMKVVMPISWCDLNGLSPLQLRCLPDLTYISIYKVTMCNMIVKHEADLRRYILCKEQC